MGKSDRKTQCGTYLRCFFACMAEEGVEGLLKILLRAESIERCGEL